MLWILLLMPFILTVPPAKAANMKKIGIIGYGSVGQFLADRIMNDPHCGETMELAFVWNRSPDKLDDGKLPAPYRMTGNLEEAFTTFVGSNAVDMLVEVAHPDIVNQLGSLFLEHCDLFVTSVAALGNPERGRQLMQAAESGKYGLHIPAGAGWGVQDIRKMDQLGTLEGLEVTMSFNAQALRLRGPQAIRLEEYLAAPDETGPLMLHKGNIREIAEFAPNNVNTMICLALAGSSVGLDGAIGCLIAQKEHNAHIVEILVRGPDGFQVKTTRHNPARKDSVTGTQTYGSFLASLLQAGGHGPGLHFC